MSSMRASSFTREWVTQFLAMDTVRPLVYKWKSSVVLQPYILGGAVVRKPEIHLST